MDCPTSLSNFSSICLLTCVTQHICRGQKSYFLPFTVSFPGIRLWLLGFGNKYFYLLGHLAGPSITDFQRKKARESTLRMDPSARIQERTGDLYALPKAVNALKEGEALRQGSTPVFSSSILRKSVCFHFCLLVCDWMSCVLMTVGCWNHPCCYCIKAHFIWCPPGSYCLFCLRQILSSLTLTLNAWSARHSTYLPHLSGLQGLCW